MSTEETLGAAIRSESNDSCVLALEQNWSAILAASALEITQWGWDELQGWILPSYWAVWFVSLIPVVGSAASRLLYATFLQPFAINWARTYAAGALGDISMARSNTNCAANTYFETREILKVDKAFSSDSDYYLNSIEAS